MNNADVFRSLKVTAEIFGKTFSDAALRVFADDLSGYPTESIVDAIGKCRRELRYFPSVADIISRIQALDGRPGVEEAWAICPKSEFDTAVWTPEIRNAFFEAAQPLLAQDPMAARMAFKEKYTALLAQARALKTPVTWEITSGTDKLQREGVILKAIEQGKISSDLGTTLLPDLSFRSSTKSLELIDGQKGQKRIGELLPDLKSTDGAP